LNRQQLRFDVFLDRAS